MTARPRIVGVDLSLTGTGIAAILAGKPCQIHTFGSKGHRGDSVSMRAFRLTTIAKHVRTYVHDADLTVVEGPSLGSQGPGTWDRAGLWWLVMTELLDSDRSVAVVPPAVLKKFAAGRGNADKSAVAAGLARLWPDVEAANDNEWDALGLASMGAQRMGLGVPTRAHHSECLAKVQWPGLSAEDERWIAEDTRHKHNTEAASWEDR